MFGILHIGAIKRNFSFGLDGIGESGSNGFLRGRNGSGLVFSIIM
jgi:hypothetical protein